MSERSPARWEKMAVGVERKAPSPHIDPEYPGVQRWENGLILHNEFITEEEEASMIDAILKNEQWTGIGKRLTLHYGPHFDYTTFGASETAITPPPAFITDLLPRLPIRDYIPDQFTVQYYPPGTGIPPHVDTHSAFREVLFSLSIGSDVSMSFRRCGETEARRMRKPKRSLMGNPTTPKPPIKDPAEPKRDETEAKEGWDLVLPRRSLLIMTGPSRYGWTHKIKGRKFDLRDGEMVERQGRYSITMRSVKRGDEVGCECDFPDVCDARIREQREQGLIE